MEKLKPDTQRPKYVELAPAKRMVPKIIISSTAMKWIEAIVDEHPLEVGFYGVVDERTDLQGKKSYFVRDIYYPKHEAMEAATCEISAEGEADLLEYLCEKNLEDDIPKVKRFWGHSHHNMGTSPSKQDEDQALDIMRQTQNYLIRAICNKKGSMSLSFFDYDEQIRYDHVPFTVESTATDELLEGILNRIREAVTVHEEGKSNRDKILEIRDIIMKDTEAEQIREWVKELKEENTPPARTYTTNYHNRYHGHAHQNTYMPGGSKKNENQQTMFSHERKGKTSSQPFEEDDFGMGPFNKETGTFDDEIVEILDRFEGGRM